jgi:hypothetical protein
MILKVGWGVGGVVCCFGGQFCDVAKLVIIHKKCLAKFGFKLEYETLKNQNTFFYIFDDLP